MFTYHLRLAWLSLKQTPLLTALMIGAIALGIGVSMTTLTVYYLMSDNPIPSKSEELFAVRVDGWNPDEPYDDEKTEQAPYQLTYTDAVGLLESDLPTRQAAMVRGVFTIQPESAELAPFRVVARMTGKDFFPMFDVPFLYGSGWSDADDTNARPVVVLSRETNQKLFGGSNSVGREIRIGDQFYSVAGVIDDWMPMPKFYDVNNGAFDEGEDIFMPFSRTANRQIDLSGNVNCWKRDRVDTWDDFLRSECVWIQFWAELKNAEQQDAYLAWLNGYSDEQKKLGRMQRPTNNRISPVMEWMEIRNVVQNDNEMLVGLSLMFLAVCLFNTVGLLLARFVGKSAVVGLRRALGASKLDIFRQHLVEVSLIGLAGGLAGLVLSLLGLQGVQLLYEDYNRLAHLNPTLVAMALAIAVLSSLVAGLYPTWRICQIAPANYLKTQ